MEVDEVEIVDLGKAVERLREHPDFILVIEQSYINTQVMALGRDFDGLDSELDTLKAITHLSRHLQSKVDEARVLVESNSK